MEQFPNLTKKQESPNKLLENLKKKLNIAILYGSISLTALVAVGCGSKKSEQGEGTPRFTQARGVVKNEKENKPKGLEALSPVKYQDHMRRLREAELSRTSGDSSAYSNVLKKVKNSLNQNSNSLSETEKKLETEKPKPFVSNPDDF